MSAITLSPGAAFAVDAVTKKVEQVQLKETGYGKRRTAVFVFHDCILPLVDNAGVGGQIANQLFAFPAMGVNVTSASAHLTIERNSGTTTSLSDTFDGDFGMGTTTGIGATLATTEQDILGTTTIPQAVAGKATFDSYKTDVPAPYAAFIDASAGTKVGFLNILVDDADQDGSTTPATVKINGTITLNYEVV